MIIEQRTYTLLPGKLPEFLNIYEELGLPIQLRILGNLIAAITTEVGPLNQYIHLWGYESMADREARRAKLAVDPDWPTYLATAAPMFQSMESKICVPARYSPIR